jgi:hypothetical protein
MGMDNENTYVCVQMEKHDEHSSKGQKRYSIESESIIYSEADRYIRLLRMNKDKKQQ